MTHKIQEDSEQIFFLKGYRRGKGVGYSPDTMSFFLQCCNEIRDLLAKCVFLHDFFNEILLFYCNHFNESFTQNQKILKDLLTKLKFFFRDHSNDQQKFFHDPLTKIMYISRWFDRDCIYSMIVTWNSHHVGSPLMEITSFLQSFDKKCDFSTIFFLNPDYRQLILLSCNMLISIELVPF